MSYALVVDTNVFLNADSDAGCARVFKRIFYCPDYSLIVDRQGEIRKEYRRIAKRFPESKLRSLVQKIMENEQAQGSAAQQLSPETISIRCKISSEFQELLACHQCSNPIEPQLFGLVNTQDDVKLVLLPNIRAKDNVIDRGYHVPGVLDRLCSHLAEDVRANVVTAHDTSWLSEPGPRCPTNEEQLRSLLEKYRTDENNIETEWLEAKCPDHADRGPSSGLAVGIMKAICALSNSVTGYVFVGVKNNGEVRAMERKYRGIPKNSWDDVWLAMTSSLFDGFTPTKPVLNSWIIPIGDESANRCVIAIKVHKQTKRLRFKNDEYVRLGTSSVKC